MKIFNNIAKFFREYIKSINWYVFIGWYLLFNIGLLVGKCSIDGFLLTNLLFLFISLMVYMKWKYKIP
jgi:hypothetical protein